MREVVSRLRAALSPQALLWLAALLLIAFGLRGQEADSASSLERRIGQTLSSVHGAGRVQVVIRTQTLEQRGTLTSTQERTMISGAVAVAQGADDPLVAVRLQEALCALLGLPAASVSVITGGK